LIGKFQIFLARIIAMGLSIGLLGPLVIESESELGKIPKKARALLA
jgi:hypothetical protein